MKTIVFGPSAAGDEALENSRWLAGRHIERLGEAGIAIVDADATRARLEAALDAPGVGGVALCGHGDGGKALFLLHNQHHDHDEAWQRRYEETSAHGAVYGSDDGPAFDDQNAERFAGRWVHVLSCEVGLSNLPEIALSRGAIAFASYAERLVPEFTVSSLPPGAAAILGRVATMTTEQLAGGQFDADTLAAGVLRANEELDAWFDSEDGVVWGEAEGLFERVGLTKFARQLSSALRVVVPA